MDPKDIKIFQAEKSFVVDPAERNRLVKKYDRMLRWKGGKRGPKSIVDMYYDTEIEDKSILIAGLGVNVRGSMQYILNELNYDERFKDYKIYVRTKTDTTDPIVKGYIEQNGWTRTSTVPKGYNNRLEACKYMITESYFPYQWTRRPEQVMIDIWHGTPLKNLGVKKEGKKSHYNSRQQKNFLCASYLLYPNYYTRNVMWDSYRITSLLNAKALMLGYPRTSGMTAVTEERKEELKKILAPNGEKLYAYMPTFRGHLSDADTVAREVEFLTFLDERLRDDQILYVNLHHHVKEGLDCSVFKHIQTFPPLIDSYELLTCTEALISDYSSVFFDYLILGKQIILYIEDYDDYMAHQGMNMDIRDLPFDLAETKEQVVEMLNRGKQYDDSEYRGMMCAFDHENNAELLCRLFRGDETGLDVEPIPKNDKKKVLLYTDGCAPGEPTERLNEIAAAYDKDAYEIYVGCDEFKTDLNKDSAYPLLHNSLLIDSVDNAQLSSLGQPILDLYKAGRVPFKKAMGYLVHEYGLLPVRMYDRVVFDVMGIYDTVNPEVVLGLALSSAKKKVLFITDKMIEQMKGGDTFMRDAVAFAADYMSAVVAASEQSADEIKRLGILGRKYVNNITVAGDAADTIDLIKALCSK